MFLFDVVVVVVASKGKNKSITPFIRARARFRHVNMYMFLFDLVGLVACGSTNRWQIHPHMLDFPQRHAAIP